MARRGRLAIAVLVLGLGAAAWQGLAGRRPSADVQGVSEEVQAFASTSAVRIDVQYEHYLTIAIAGSVLDELPVARKRSAAREIAARAYRRYPSPTALRFVVVAFVDEGRRLLLVFPERRVRDSFQFAVRTPTSSQSAACRLHGCRHWSPMSRRLCACSCQCCLRCQSIPPWWT